jgi:NMD protein affecting ribosome stability and mRNA decay
MIYSNDQYFEAKIQIRPYDEEVIDFFFKLIDNNSNILITKETKIKTGADFLVTSQKEAQKIAKQLKKRFGGKIILSRKLFSIHRQTSRKVWRVTVCFRLEKAL